MEIPSSGVGLKLALGCGRYSHLKRHVLPLSRGAEDCQVSRMAWEERLWGLAFEVRR